MPVNVDGKAFLGAVRGIVCFLCIEVAKIKETNLNDDFSVKTVLHL